MNLSELMPFVGGKMTSATERTRNRMISKERRAELERQGRLRLPEAAEYLEMAPKTLHNKLSMARENPALAPRGRKGRNGWEFDVSELKAWDRQN